MQSEQRLEPARKTRPFIRDLGAGRTIETFFVCAIAAILSIRFFLRLTGYPRLGGESLHIAHLVWGGLLMLAAFVILFSYISKRARDLAAVLGGIGFGTFIDELGKFITSDNDYFYRPSVALIYLFLVLAIWLARSIQTGRQVTEAEYLVNALQEVREVALDDLDRDEQMRAIRYLKHSDAANPLVRPLREIVEKALLVPVPAYGLVAGFRRFLGQSYRKLASLPAFNRSVMLFFFLQQIVNVTYLVLAIGWGTRGPFRSFHLPIPGWWRGDPGPLESLDYADIISNAISAGLVAAGILRLRRSRIEAYRMFRRSVLVSIFLTEVFSFYREQFWAMIGLAINILIWITLRYMAGQERLTEAAGSPRPSSVADPQEDSRVRSRQSDPPEHG